MILVLVSDYTENEVIIKILSEQSANIVREKLYFFRICSLSYYATKLEFIIRLDPFQRT